MESNRLKELFELTKETLIKGEERYQYGICKAINEVFDVTNSFNIREYKFVKKYLFDNKPTPDNEYKEFTNNEYWDKNKLVLFWWKPIDDFPKTKQIRIDYLTKLIDNIK